MRVLACELHVCVRARLFVFVLVLCWFGICLALRLQPPYNSSSLAVVKYVKNQRTKAQRIRASGAAAKVARRLAEEEEE